MRVWCLIFGHKMNDPVLNARGGHSHMTCRRCDLFLVPDYFDGWQRATRREREHRLRVARRSTTDTGTLEA